MYLYKYEIIIEATNPIYSLIYDHMISGCKLNIVYIIGMVTSGGRGEPYVGGGVGFYQPASHPQLLAQTWN